MAFPVTFDGATTVLTAPEGLEDRVLPLPVAATPDGDLVSCWQLTDVEVREIARTGRIWLSVSGGQHPPILITGFRRDALRHEHAPVPRQDLN